MHVGSEVQNSIHHIYILIIAIYVVYEQNLIFDTGHSDVQIPHRSLLISHSI